MARVDPRALLVIHRAASARIRRAHRRVEVRHIAPQALLVGVVVGIAAVVVAQLLVDEVLEHSERQRQK